MLGFQGAFRCLGMVWTNAGEGVFYSFFLPLRSCRFNDIMKRQVQKSEQKRWHRQNGIHTACPGILPCRTRRKTVPLHFVTVQGTALPCRSGTEPFSAMPTLKEIQEGLT